MRNGLVFVGVCLALAGCVSSVVVKDKNHKRIAGIPYPVMTAQLKPGLLVQHTEPKTLCEPVQVQKVVMVPVEGDEHTLYLSPGAGFFTGQDFSVTFNDNGTLKSVNGKSEPPSAGVAAFVSSLASHAAITDQPDGEHVVTDAKPKLPPCNDGFVMTND